MPERAPLRRARRGRPAVASARARSGGPTEARRVALRVLERVEHAGAYADLALHAALAERTLSRVDRALATELAYGTLRWRGRLDHLLSKVSHRELSEIEPRVRCVLRLGAYQLAFADRIPATAAVDQSVRCARAAGAARAAGLVNAVLRRLAAELASIRLPELESDPLGHLVHALSLPPWLAERWLAELGAEQAAALARAQSRAPTATVRANRRRTTRDALLAELRMRHPDAQPCRFAPDGIRIGARLDPGAQPAFRDGRFTVQDEAAQLVVELLAPAARERILDACAAPGAKTTAIAERLGDTGHVIALDRHRARLSLLGRELRRLALRNVETRHLDASSPLGDLPQPLDRVLVDAPCSGLGTLRRNPDLRWRITPEDLPRLAATQLAILRRASGVLKVGGTLVYSTCTLLPDENEAVIRAFLSEAGSFRVLRRDELPEAVRPVADADGTVRCLPHVHDTDGFFAVRMERVS